MTGVKITMQDGGVDWVDPVVDLHLENGCLVVFNGSHTYEYPEVSSYEYYDVDQEEEKPNV